jgi:hypothetical protein
MTCLAADYWKLELETARRYADGLVIWGGWASDDRPAEWGDQAAWCQVTKQFLSQFDSVAPARPIDLTVQ